MVALTESLLASKSPWLDYTAYAGRLFAAGRVPWLSIDGTLAWLRQAQGLLRSSVVQLPIRSIVAAWLEQNPELIRSMSGRSRIGHPLKTLLIDPGLRSHLSSLCRATAASLPSAPVVLNIPSPRAWLRQAYQHAFPQLDVEPNDDAIDSAATHIADFLRGFSPTEIAGLLLSEEDEPASPSAETVGLYRPIFNLATHYRWNVGILSPNSRAAGEAAAPGPDFWIGQHPFPGKGHGLMVPESFWSDAVRPELPEGCFLFATIPANALPETVLERLALLQSQR